MPTINTDANGGISITLQFRYLEKMLNKILQKLDSIEQKLDTIEQQIEKVCGGKGQMG